MLNINKTYETGNNWFLKLGRGCLADNVVYIDAIDIDKEEKTFWFYPRLL